MWAWEDIVAQSVWSLIMRGNLFVWPTRDNQGRVVGVGVVPPDDVTVVKQNAGTAVGTTFPKVAYRVNGRVSAQPVACALAGFARGDQGDRERELNLEVFHDREDG